MKLTRWGIQPRKRLYLDGIWIGMHVLEKDTARYGMVREIRGEIFYITLANGIECVALRRDIESVVEYHTRTFGLRRDTIAD